jgi:hypothetical protein
MALSKVEIRQALNILTRTPAAASAPRDAFSIESEAVAENSRPWTQGDNIQGLGIGHKISAGKELEWLALRVYVDEKRPIDDVANPVPREVAVPRVGAVPTDVIEIGKLEPELFRERADPMMPGCGLAHHDVTVGTFGCVVRRRQDDGKRYVLSNSHVLANSGLAQAGDAILQPGPVDGGNGTNDKVARLTDFVKFDYAQTGFPNHVDAAIAEITDRAYLREIRSLGIAPQGVGRVIRAGMKVHKVGRTTSHTWGQIEDTDFQVQLHFPDPNRPPGSTATLPVFFRDQVLCTRYTDSGDSGSLVLTQRNLAVGLHFAGSQAASVFNRIRNVFDLLSIELDI